MNKTKAVIITIAVLAIITGGFFISCVKKSGPKQLYTCPMHPYYITDKPGNCPICGMTLVAIKPSSAPSPENVSPTTEKAPDRVAVKIDPEKQQLIDIETAVVKKRELGNFVYAVGTVAYDPELYYAQSQYISDLLSFNKASAGGLKDDIGAAKESLSSDALRLKVMGFSGRQIEELKIKAAPDKSLLLPGHGGDVWIYAQVYQDDLEKVKQGASTEITVPSDPETVFNGKVAAVDPAINPETRSIRVRILVKNGGDIFRPDMYVNVKIKSITGEYLSVPEEAVLDTGSEKIAYVDKGDGYFEPRDVVTGPLEGDFYPVKSGLTEGEKVAVNANFMIDSESQLKAAIQPTMKTPTMKTMDMKTMNM